ncbi:TonB-dependent receptor [Neotamlana laminarinivorans]|uniref:TonB-dependent receptor family protein n=1 Tax=Neotamlana laminarinivorans TaxID=2883124 RepID=A0A9X1HY51_9FLAO|nr:TonB-dependent receptor [Tamlana laminarinivorans]MCB4798055.1 TonB-dependent receptor family protein [Tamlana laminarinivorans]
MYTIIFPFITNAQNIILEGIVTDTINSPLENTNILARPLSSNLNMAFTITNSKGYYKLNLHTNEPYEITVSYLGFSPFKFNLTITEATEKNIILISATDVLDEVVIIKNTPPVIIKEDTISYKTDAFNTGTERKLKDVLKNLPGIDVDKNGNVKVMGKKVSTLLVDNKPFFNGNTKLGIENIPANAVESINAIDNYTSVSFLKGLSSSEKMALNIKLKKDKKRFLFGDVEAGTGIAEQEHYLVHPNVFYYSPKTTFNFIGDVNDVGIKSFTLKDYLNFEGGIGKLFSNPSSYFQSTNDYYSQFLNGQDFTLAQNKFAALNFVRALNSKWSLSGYGIASKIKTNTTEETTNNYFFNDSNTVENKTDNQSNNQRFVFSKLLLEYKPSTKEDLSYNSFVKQTSINNVGNIFLSTLLSENNLSTNYKNNSTEIKQNVEWHKKYNTKHTTSLTFNYKYLKQNPTNYWITDLPILNDFLPLIEDDNYNINHFENNKQQTINLLIKHYWVLNKNNHIYTTIGNNNLTEKYNTEDYQKLSNTSLNNFESANFNNSLIYKANDLFLGIEHKFQKGIFSAKYGLETHFYNWNINQNFNKKITKQVWLPSLQTKLKFSGSNSLSFKYNLKSSIASANKYANKYWLKSYNNIVIGNTDLENELFHTLNLNYLKFSLYKGLTFASNLTYKIASKGINYNTEINGINQINAYILLKNPEKTWLTNVMLQKRINNFSVTLNTDLIFSDIQLMVNNENYKSKSNSENYELEISTDFKKLPNFELSLKKQFDKFIYNNNNSTFITTIPKFAMDYNFLNGFIFNFNYEKTIYKNYNNQKNSYNITDTSLLYDFNNSPWSIKLSGTNIFNTKFKNSNSISDYLITNKQTYIQPNIWLFSVNYDL